MPMTARRLLLSFVLATATGTAAEPTFAELLDRVSERDPITRAILEIDDECAFALGIDGERARVRIWRPMKVADPEAEAYTFPVTDVIRQEHRRLQFQDELDALVARCRTGERRFRVARYQRFPVRYGMPYREVLAIVGDAFVDDGHRRAAAGAYRLISETHAMVFQHGVLVDIRERTTDAGDGAGTPAALPR